MKASERLRELSEVRYQPAATADIRRALPLIADVVEAAERFVLSADESEMNERTFAIDDSLTALRDALQQPEGNDE